MNIIAASAIIIAGVYSCQSYASGDYVMMRYTNYNATPVNVSELKYLHIFDNDAGILLTSYYDLGRDVGQLKATQNEAEFWHPLFVSEDRRFQVFDGAQLTIQTAGTFFCANLGAYYHFTDDFSLGARYRYIKFNYKTPDLNNSMKYSDFSESDLYLNYTFNPKWSVEVNATYSYYFGNYEHANGKKDNLAIKNTLSYKLNDTWTIQPRIGWVGRNASRHKEDIMTGIAAMYKF